MKNRGKRRFVSEKEIEQFCQSAAMVLKKIRDRISEKQSKKR